MFKNKHTSDFMAQFPHEGLTFDDVSLVTQYADFMPDETDLSCRLTARIGLNIPFVSAAMDTVTESEMAIAMALQGGIGIIHRNLSPEQQRAQVGTVKHHLHGLIRDPIVFRDTDSLQHVQDRRREKGYTFSGFPILNTKDQLVGILTAADMKYADASHARVDELMTRDVITAAPDTDLKQAYEIMVNKKIGKLPLVEKGKLVGLYSFSDVSALVKNVHPHYNRDARYRLRVGAAVGPADYARAEALAAEDVDVFAIDSAHGHSKGIIEMVRWLAKHYPEIDIIAGNVGTGEGAVALRDAGAHAIKVGIGPGSICTTRVVCGVGVPQITAIYEARKALGDSIPVIGDGGIRHSGDVPKAIAAGADAVMLGSVLASTEESPGEKIIHQGRQYVAYRGMGSVAALRSGQGSRSRYSTSTDNEEDLVPQGIEGIVPYSGTVKKVMTQYCGGVRFSLGYCGCRTLAELQAKGRFVRVSLAGMTEAHPHDVKIMKEAPNYKS